MQTSALDGVKQQEAATLSQEKQGRPIQSLPNGGGGVPEW